MTIRRLSVAGVDTTGYPFSHIVVDGDYAFLSGVVASDLPGGQAVLGDLGRETQLVMSAIRDALAGIQLGMDRIVRVDVHLTDLDRMPELDRAYGAFFPGNAYPARTCTESKKLAGGSNVEITVLARL